MIRELIERLKKWAQETAAALKEKLAAAVHTITPPVSAGICAGALIVASEGNALDAGKMYRLTSGHAPVFSLFTFFGIR
jgi:hypothetical protein